jgi:Domain of unknown function (DUF4159)
MTISWQRRLGLAVASVLLAFPVFGQFGTQRWGPRLAKLDDFDGSWQFCRLAYQGRGWATDYPDADYNFSTRLGELTKTAITRQSNGDPHPVIIRPTDDTLFRCGFVILWQAESLWFTEEDAARLRTYLLKGGFLWSDDSWGTYAWNNFADQMAKVLPPSQYRFVDIPRDHTLFHTLFDVPKVPQIPGISFWFGSGGRTSEQGADSAEVHVRGIFDAHGRLMVLSTHNTDIADGWEREGVSAEYFHRFSVDSYAVGINVAMYGVTN